MTKKMKSLGLLTLAIGMGCNTIFAQTTASVDTIAKETIRRIFRPMERFKGKAMMLPEVVACLSALRYAEATGDKITIEKIKNLYLASYRDGKNSLSYGNLEDQVTAIIPMELYRLTGDKELIAGCKTVVEGQRLNATETGIYRLSRNRPSDVFIIGTIQALGNDIFADKKSLEFAGQNILKLVKEIAPRERYALRRELTLRQELSRRNSSVDKSTLERLNMGLPLSNLDHNFAFWYANRGMVSLGIVEVLRSFPQNSSLQNKLINEFQEQMSITDKPVLTPFPGTPFMRISDLGSGIKAHNVFDVGMWIYAACTGINQGWLDKDKYTPIVKEMWWEIATNFKSELPLPNEPYHIIYRPYLEWSGVLFAATGMDALDNKEKYTKAKLIEVKTNEKININTAISKWAILRSSIIKGDKSSINNIDNNYRNSEYGKTQIKTRQHTDIGQVLIAMELFRLTNKVDIQMGVNWILDNIIDDKINCENKIIPALIMAQAFKTYGGIKYQKKAIKLWSNNNCKPQWLLSFAMGKETYKAEDSANIAEIKVIIDAISAKSAKQLEFQQKINKRKFADIAKSLLVAGKEKDLAIALAKRDISELGNDISKLNENEKIQLIFALSIVNPDGDEIQLKLINQYLSNTPNILTSKNMLTAGFAYSRAIELLKDAKYADLGYELMKNYCQKLQTENGFFRSAENAISSSKSTGQASLGLSLFLRALPKTNTGYFYLKTAYEKLSKTLQRTQDANGFWHISPNNWNSKIDSGGTAMLSASLAIGLEQIWIEQIEYRNMLKLAIIGLKNNLDDKTRLINCAISPEIPFVNNVENLERSILIDGEPLAMLGLSYSLSEATNYWDSSQVDAKENMVRALGPLFDLTCRGYVEKLDDGRVIQHFSGVGKVELAHGKSSSKDRGQKRMKVTEKEFLNRVPYKGWWDGKGVPESLQKQPFPCGGISIWLKDNPSVHMVTSDAGYWTLPMAYCVLTKRAKEELIVCIQARGEKPLEVKIKQTTELPYHFIMSNSILKDLCTGVCEPANVKDLPKGPADFVNGYLVAERLLEHRRNERAKLLKLMETNPTPILLDNNKILLPVYLKGKVVSEIDGKPVKEVSVWLKRNPCIITRSKTGGEFELMFNDAVLYEQEQDSLMLTAPEYKPQEISLKSYLNDNLSITMQPHNTKLEVVNNGTVPMIRIPSGFFRMGKGAYYNTGDNYLRTDGFYGNCWPIKTTYMPSFFYSQYGVYKEDLDVIVTWANKNGYNIKNRFFPLICNAMSEMDNLTPCYYKANLSVIRKPQDLTESMICNWQADGYRLPTFAERTYACRAGTTSSMFWGMGYAKKQLDQIITPQARAREFGHHTSYGSVHAGENKSYSVRPARRLPLTWGIYDNYYGMGACDRLWDSGYWLAEETFNPRGPSLKQRLAINRIHFGLGGSDLLRMSPYNLDWLEMQFFDEWEANPTGLFCNDWGPKHDDLAWCSIPHSSMWIPNRFVRSVENICNDISLLKKVKDSTLNLPKPVSLEKINEKINMVEIIGGKITIGNRNPLGFRGNPKVWRVPACPAHSIQVDAFSMAQFETTIQQWQFVQQWAIKNGYSDLPNGEIGKTASNDIRHPVVGVNWYDVVKWCNAVSEMEKLNPCYLVNDKVYKTGQNNDVICNWKTDGYRLPTETEWEYAASGGIETNYYWGAYPSQEHCWMRHNEIKYSAQNMSHPVGQKIANQYGLYDIIGNVYEWCWDWAAPYNMRKDDVTNPKGPDNLNQINEYFTSMDKKEFAKIKKIWKNKKVQGRCLRGGDYTSKIMWNHHGMLGDWERGVCNPKENKEIVGFRVVRDK